jgi:BirA family transcriptional regulator, biotin operon repressor / biotin---[acetyl-CoA-carboxylase] ligase
MPSGQFMPSGSENQPPRDGILSRGTTPRGSTLSLEVERVARRSFVRQCRFFEQLDSTSNEARRILEAEPSAPRPLLVIARRQTQGRGRGNHLWWSAEGSLTFTLIVDSPRAARQAELRPLLSLVVGKAVCLALSRWLPAGQVRVKWPNDVYVGDRKISGILLEASDRRPETLLVGIGVNANNSLRNAPAELRTIATSLRDALGKPCDVHELLRSILERIAEGIGQYERGTLQLAEDWPRHCYLTGRRVAVRQGQQLHRGICLGLSPSGQLRLSSANDQVVSVHSGTVTLVD